MSSGFVILFSNLEIVQHINYRTILCNFKMCALPTPRIPKPASHKHIPYTYIPMAILVAILFLKNKEHEKMYLK